MIEPDVALLLDELHSTSSADSNARFRALMERGQHDFDSFV